MIKIQFFRPFFVVTCVVGCVENRRPSTKHLPDWCNIPGSRRLPRIAAQSVFIIINDFIIMPGFILKPDFTIKLGRGLQKNARMEVRNFLPVADNVWGFSCNEKTKKFLLPMVSNACTLLCHKKTKKFLCLRRTTRAGICVSVFF